MQKNEIGNQKTTRNSLGTMAIAGLLIVAMFAALTPAAEAAHDLSITWQNTNALTAWTYWQSPYLAWNTYCTTYCGYLLKWDGYGNTLDAPYKNSKNIYTSYGQNGVIKATTMTDYVGTASLWGECVSMVKALSKSTVGTKDWTKGKRVMDFVDGRGYAVRGNAVATFFGSGGGYYGHVAVFDSYYYVNGKLSGIVVWDQNWWNNGVVGYHVIMNTGSGVSDADNYYIVQVP